MERKKAQITLGKAKKRAVYAFQKWVRHRGHVGNINTCVTCGRMYPVSGRGVIQAGHFVVGRHNAILFDERNCFPQCYGCNIGKKGNVVKFYKFMLANFGQKVIDELERLSNTTVIFSIQDYLDIEKKYQDKLENGEGVNVKWQILV